MSSEKTILDYKTTEQKFKPFHQTFSHCAFFLSIALMYPNKNNIPIRVFVFGMFLLFNGYIIYCFCTYHFKCLIRHDMYNLSRNTTVGILISLFFFKTFYVSYKSQTFGELLKKITEDLLKGNHMEHDYQEIYEHYIKLGKMGEFCWILIPVLLSLQFPLYASMCTIIESLKSDTGKRYMVHEMDIKYLEDKQYESPYYEMIFAYSLMQCFILVPNFSGFDGSFCVATNHLRLKLKLITRKLYKAFKDSENRTILRARVIESIKEHQEALQFYNHLQEMYGGWLLMVFLVTSLMISLSLYMIFLTKRVDPVYTIFAISGVVHMLAPCYYACNLVKSSEDFSVDIYHVQWEQWSDVVVTKLLTIMIVKAQQPLILSGQGLVYFNMQLFITVLQTSYSVFTLISS
ncbi:odorant receptor 10-like [Battus philenor]|uniref:odorant receptor 10-like n=1 Tax=Battus philenor TaxID=42288 RepID=UPI0035CF2372